MTGPEIPAAARGPEWTWGEPQPIPNDGPSMHDLVIFDMESRKRFGLAKYGTPLQAHNGRDALNDAYEETLDLVVYLRQAIAERDGVAPVPPAPTAPEIPAPSIPVVPLIAWVAGSGLALCAIEMSLKYDSAVPWIAQAALTVLGLEAVVHRHVLRRLRR